MIGSFSLDQVGTGLHPWLDSHPERSVPENEAKNPC
jgi:hypothetical protein